MSNIKDILMQGETLFRNESVFTPSYVPEDFIHRDGQLEELRIALKPGLRGLNPINLLIHGPPGTGKTTAVKSIFNQINEISDKLITVYINCDDFSTPYSIFASIYKKIYNVTPPDTGKPLESIKERVFHQLKRLEKSIVICLDELDRLFIQKYTDQVLVDILKAHSTYGYDKIGIIGIMINDELMVRLSEKARSVFNPTRVMFQPYSKSEMMDILANRVKFGFYDGVISDNILTYVVEKTYGKGADLRIGIDILRRAGLVAESDSSKKIEKKHIDRAFGNLVVSQSDDFAEKSLDNDEEKLLDLIKKSDDTTSGKIYKLFHNETNIGIKKYNELIKILEHKRLIQTEYKKGVKGRSREIKLIS